MKVPSNRWNGKVVAGPNCCHIFTGPLGGGGYGVIGKNGRSNYAHRLMYEECWGPILQGLMVLHKCNVRRCVNPLHLYAGTAADNMGDRKESGYVVSEETSQKISNSKLGNKHSEEHKIKISQGMLGKKNTLGNKLTEEHKSKISKALLDNKNSLGKKHSQEYRLRRKGFSDKLIHRILNTGERADGKE